MSAPSVNDPLGFDAYLGADDIDATGRSATGLELLDAAILHRLQCEYLEMIDAPTVNADGDPAIPFGVNVRKWVGEVTDRSSAAAKAPFVDEVLHRDPRVRTTAVRVELAPPGAFLSDKSQAALVIFLQVTSTAGDRIDRVVGVSQVTVEFLAGGR